MPYTPTPIEEYPMLKSMMEDARRKAETKDYNYKDFLRDLEDAMVNKKRAPRDRLVAESRKSDMSFRKFCCEMFTDWAEFLTYEEARPMTPDEEQIFRAQIARELGYSLEKIPLPGKAIPKEVEEEQPKLAFTICDFKIVENFKKMNSIAEVALIILTSGWDFADPRNRMYSSPAEVRSFLEQVIDEWPNRHFMDVPNAGQRGLIATICHSWLSWARAELIND